MRVQNSSISAQDKDAPGLEIGHALAHEIVHFLTETLDAIGVGQCPRDAGQPMLAFRLRQNVQLMDQIVDRVRHIGIGSAARY